MKHGCTAARNLAILRGYAPPSGPVDFPLTNLTGGLYCTQ